MKKIILITISTILIILIFSVTIYPTVYKYDKLGNYIVKINRLTGETNILTGNGWLNQKQFKEMLKN